VKKGIAVILVSGGLDSATCLGLAKRLGFRLYALTIQYGQRHQAELKAARRLARYYRVKKHLILNIPLAAIGGSALTNRRMMVPKGRSPKAIARNIPSTYVPARNTIFLSLALAWSEVLGARHLFIGVNARDYSGYPDCRPAYLKTFEKMAKMATKKGVEGKWAIRVHTPLIRMTKAQIIRKGMKIGVPYRFTHSCYDPMGSRPCGHCDSCLLRAKGFKEAGFKDPALRGHA
jgi:7-cyano-7-deazaguanine synthase